jgi:hypothetical protein
MLNAAVRRPVHFDDIIDAASAPANDVASTQRNAIEAGWMEMTTTSPMPAQSDCIVLGDSDLFDVESVP